MIVDIGGGTTEVAVISLGGMVAGRSIRIAGDEMDQEIVNFMRQRHNLLIGERTAEAIKIGIGSALVPPPDDRRGALVRGRDIKTGSPREMEVSNAEVTEAISGSVRAIMNIQCAYCAPEVQIFCPLITKSSPSRTARVCSDARSDPEPGSLKPWHHCTSPERMRPRCSFFCSSLPWTISVGPTIETPMPPTGGTRFSANSSFMMNCCMTDSPAPP